ncbi:MAG: homoserine kinase [Chloroflexota bacterium]|nr:homoserine kinase [Chloroflexota bacterium]MDE2929477.1 homoserine kinase [Chloroflexota bacterium]
MASDFPDIRVRVPASTANLGPGFDAFGMALTVYNAFTVQATTGESEVTVTGEGETELSHAADNLFLHAFARGFSEAGESPPAISLHMQNDIPLYRGLGSSASATVGGLVAANHMLEKSLSEEKLLQLACDIEGHPDNVAAALFGGLIVCAAEGGDIPAYARIPVPPNLHAVVCVPDQHLPTELARSVVPQEVSLGDAVFSVGRAALLLTGIMQSNEESIRAGMQDRLHQPYRATIFPAMQPIMDAALAAGACGSALSGAGSSILALTFRNPDAIAAAMLAAAYAHDTPARSLILSCAEHGASVVPLDLG